MIRIPQNLDGARLNVTETAELLSMDAGHFRRLVRRGVFPAAKKTAKGLPYYDHDLLVQLAEVIKRRVGLNGEEVMWYRRKPKGERPAGRRRQAQSSPQAQDQPAADDYLLAIIEGCRQLGLEDEKLGPQAVQAALAEEFSEQRPGLEQAIPAVARRLLADS
jgi:hypothetical protein